MGLAYVPEERMRDGAVGDFTVAENLMLVDYDRAPYVSGRTAQPTPHRRALYRPRASATA